jgi:hypothetical protein
MVVRPPPVLPVRLLSLHGTRSAATARQGSSSTNWPGGGSTSLPKDHQGLAAQSAAAYGLSCVERLLTNEEKLTKRLADMEGVVEDGEATAPGTGSGPGRAVGAPL